MRTSTFAAAVTALLAHSVVASPLLPLLNLDAALPPNAAKDIATYFDLLAAQTGEGRKVGTAPVCDMTNAQPPVASPTPLPAVSAGLVLKHVAIGRGTQNYTCDLSNATAIPVQTGAVATLFNASCAASTYPDFVNSLPRIAVSFNYTSSSEPALQFSGGNPDGSEDARLRLNPTSYTVSGHHYFTTTTTPFFIMDDGIGSFPGAKNASVAAPADAPKGQQGDKAVPWLKLVAKPGATGGLQEVYRLETAGGSAPATCVGAEASFEVQYAAQYWFYS